MNGNTQGTGLLPGVRPVWERGRVHDVVLLDEQMHPVTIKGLFLGLTKGPLGLHLMAKVSRSSNLLIGSSSWRAVSWESEDSDPSGLADLAVNNEVLTIPRMGAGWWRVLLQTHWPAIGVDHYNLKSALRVNGSAVAMDASYVNQERACVVAWEGTLADADRIEARVYQDTGSDVALQGGLCWMGASRLWAARPRG